MIDGAQNAELRRRFSVRQAVYEYLATDATSHRPAVLRPVARVRCKGQCRRLYAGRLSGSRTTTTVFSDQIAGSRCRGSRLPVGRSVALLPLVTGFAFSHFALQRSDQSPQLLIFSDLALKKAPGNGAFCCDARRSQQIRIRKLVAAALEVVQLDQSSFEQGLDAKVGLAEAHAQRIGQFALRHLRLVLQEAQHAKVGFFFGGRLVRIRH